MLDCKRKYPGMGVRKNISTRRQSRHFGCPFRPADDTNANRCSHNALPLLHHKENDPRLIDR